MKLSSRAETKNNSIKIGNIRVNIKSNFDSDKSLENIMFSLVNKKLNEKFA